jgi:hypothetical protein
MMPESPDRKPERPGDPGREEIPSLWERLFRFMTHAEGETEEIRGLAHDIVERDREGAERLFNALQRGSFLAPTQEEIEEAKAECEAIQEALVHYAELGERAADEMPEVSEHLDACSDCRRLLDMLRDTVASGPACEEGSVGDGLDETDQIQDGIAACPAYMNAVLPRTREVHFQPALPEQKEAAPTMFLYFSGHGWEWTWSLGQPTRRFERRDVGSGVRVGDFELVGAGAAAKGFHLAEGAPEPLRLRVTLPEAGTDVECVVLVVTPERTDQGGPRWEIHLSLGAGAAVSTVLVAVGSEDSGSTGNRTLRPDRPVKFDLCPPREQSYWLHFEWDAPKGPRTYRAELRMRQA